MSFVSQFSTNTKAQELFFQYVRDIIGRTNRYTNVPYCDDPAIMSWQIGNEPRAFNDEVKEPFAKWLRQTSALIRSLDKNHLISIGSEGIWGCEMSCVAIQLELGRQRLAGRECGARVSEHSRVYTPPHRHRRASSKASRH